MDIYKIIPDSTDSNNANIFPDLNAKCNMNTSSTGHDTVTTLYRVTCVVCGEDYL